MNNLKSEHGFSLIELSFSIAIFATSLIMISSFFINNLDSSEHSLRYRALDLCRTTLEEYKEKSTEATTRVEDYGEISDYNYNTQPFKRKIEVSGDNLQEIKVTIFWRKRGEEKQLSLTTLNSTSPYAVENETTPSNQILKKLLTAKQELDAYHQQNSEFPAWDKRSGNLKKVSDYYADFSTSLSQPEEVAYRNPSFYNWWAEGYLLVYKQPVNKQFYCLTNQSGLYTIPAKNRKAKHILGDLIANSQRDQTIFISHATQFKREANKNE